MTNINANHGQSLNSTYDRLEELHVHATLMLDRMAEMRASNTREAEEVQTVAAQLVKPQHMEQVEGAKTENSAQEGEEHKAQSIALASHNGEIYSESNQDTISLRLKSLTAVLAESAAVENSKVTAKPVQKLLQHMFHARCEQCVTDNDDACTIDVLTIEKWEQEVKAGKVFLRMPEGGNCLQCRGKQSDCRLPRTNQLRNASGKRKLNDDSDPRVVNAKKSRHDGTGGPPSEEPHWVTSLLQVVDKISQTLEVIWVQQRKALEEQKRMADVFQRLADKFRKGGPHEMGEESSQSDFKLSDGETEELEEELGELEDEVTDAGGVRNMT
jgi:hypothetical protein